MKRFAWFMIVTLALTSTTAFCAKEKKDRGRGKGGKSGLKGEYAIMANMLEFSDAQKTELTAKLTACDDEVKKWRQANADKLADIKKKQAQAKEDKNKEAMKQIAKESKGLRAEEAKLRGAAIAAAKALLTPEQKAKWDAFTVYRGVIGRLKRAELTEEQDAKVREICAAKAARIVAAEGKAKGKAYKELSTSIIDSVLTAEQKAKLTAKPTKKPRKDKKGAPEA